MPHDAARAAQDANQLFVVDTDDGAQAICSRVCAEGWIATGLSKYTDERQSHVLNPHWHSHSWLWGDELEGVINDPSVQPFDGPE
jgi:hypothetical protein